ncbi:uncharacterized protein LOC121652476 [Melanotaenia boesemani]|uniref:uncharacterized protein LOC121652476 n=1 Tax=Melanotaenia boesemani TaxID=1250792 RepID=UPI001C05493C|nr:uncharacterized protein LOC121652476 [Melanotaenia boesemani]
MAGNIVRKPLEFILIFTVHMVLNGPGQAKHIRGILGKNITLQFDFNANITDKSSFAVYTEGQNKISEYPNFKSSFKILPNNSVLYHIRNLTLENSKVYWMCLFPEFTKHSGIPITESNKVKLIVQEDDSSTTVAPATTHDNLMTPSDNGSSSLFSSNTITFLVVTSAVLLTAILSFLICCLAKTKDQETEPHRNSNPTVQETISSVEFSMNVPGPSLVYSVLDFPKRPPTVVEFNPSDTEYASVSYLPEKRQI